MKQKREKKISFKHICAFSLSVFVLHLIGCEIFPTDEATNTLEAPDWYAVVLCLAALAITFAISKVFWAKEKRPLAAPSKRFITDAAESEDYELGIDADADATECVHAPEPQPAPAPQIDIDEILQEEENWRREQRGLTPVEYELRKVDTMPGRNFEYWCASVLKRNGFKNVTVTQDSNDQGVDVVAEKDQVWYAIQCKCYSSDLGNKPVQEVFAGKEMYQCQVAVVMTNRHFTSGAKALASKTRVLLWDREKLIELLRSEQ
jgi:HJR/Mrr/RecB family endonuclease|nr:MAG TPA: Restriction endonuclease [Caudoviricetes sp.]